MGNGFFENIVLTISTGVIGGCIVSFFVSDVELEKLCWMIGLTIVFLAIIIGIYRKRLARTTTNQDENIE